MSENNTLKNKNERGAALTQKQYNIVVSYLNTGVKPTVKTLDEAGMTGKLNGGNPGPSKTWGHYNWWRFRSIIKRVSLRPTNGDLVYLANGKVILPKSKFVSAIKTTHRGTDLRKKHLNFTQTLAKLQDSYTIGRRQFGISEELVRDVVRACRDGSCAKSKRKPSVVQTLIIDESDDDQQTTPDTSANTSITTQPPPVLEPSIPVLSGPRPLLAPTCIPIPISLLEKQPNGTFIFKPRQLNTVTSQLIPSSSEQQFGVKGALASLLGNRSLVLVPASGPGLPVPSMPSMPSLQPMVMSTQGNPGPTATVWLRPQAQGYISKVPPAEQLGSMGSHTDADVKRIPSCLSEETTTQPQTGNAPKFDLEYWRRKFNLGSDEGPIMIADSSSEEDLGELPSPAPIPAIWYSYNELNLEKNPYQRIALAIQDMKVDVMKSFTYDCPAMDKLRKKIQFVECLVKSQKCATDPYRLLD